MPQPPGGKSDTLGDLVARARRGDRGAFGELVRRTQRRVYATAFHIVGRHEDADDVAQEAFVRAYRGLRSFDGRSEFTTWLHRIVINVALNHLRARKRTRAVPAAEEGSGREPVAPPATDPRAAAESRELVTAVVAALAELSPTLRVTLILATIEEMSYQSIAEALGVPEGTVAWRVNQARKLLKQKLVRHIARGDVDEVLRRTKEALGAR